MKKHILLAFLGVFLVVGLTAGSSNALDLPIQHGHLRLFHGASTNWSGFAAETNLTTPQANAVTSVSGQWIVPAVSCTSRTSNSYSSVWIGIDGYSSNSVEQTGTEQDCSRRTPVYYAWYEMYPSASFKINMAVAPGNVMTASVQYIGADSFALTLNNVTTGKSFATTKTLANAARSSAEWVVEAPSSFSGVLPLANFGTANLTNSIATITGHTGTINDPQWQNDKITMVTKSGQPKAIPSDISSDGSSFSVTWHHN